MSKGKKDRSEPRITMDHYHSTRRRKRRSTWPYAVSAVMMLVLLGLILFYQDSCGSSVSDSIFQLNQQ